MICSNRLGFYTVCVTLVVGFCGFTERANALGVLYQENFTGSASNNLNGKHPDIDNNGGTNTWAAYSGYKQNGLIPTASVNLDASLPFIPLAGNTYTLSASLTGVAGTAGSASWIALGFGKSVPTTLESGDNRFVSGASLGRAWMLFRAHNPTTPTNSPNQIHLGNTTTGTATGPQSPAPWTPATYTEGGNIDMQIVLDTNPTTWTATFFAKRDVESSYTQISSGPLNLLAQDIGMVGIARTSGSVSGMITSFKLETTAPLLIPGDVNGDGHVDVFDFNIIRDHLFTSGTRAQGDLTNDGFVDFSDFRAWKSAPPSGAGAGASLNAAVPEPASAVLAMIATACGFAARRRRRGAVSRRNM
jgi:hypothetical protein